MLEWQHRKQTKDNIRPSKQNQLTYPLCASAQRGVQSESLRNFSENEHRVAGARPYGRAFPLPCSRFQAFSGATDWLRDRVKRRALLLPIPLLLRVGTGEHTWRTNQRTVRKRRITGMQIMPQDFLESEFCNQISVVSPRREVRYESSDGQRGGGGVQQGTFRRRVFA